MKRKTPWYEDPTPPSVTGKEDLGLPGLGGKGWIGTQPVYGNRTGQCERQDL